MQNYLNYTFNLFIISTRRKNIYREQFHCHYNYLTEFTSIIEFSFNFAYSLRYHDGKWRVHFGVFPIPSKNNFQSYYLVILDIQSVPSAITVSIIDIGD